MVGVALLRIELGTTPQTGAEELDGDARRLREDLLELDVEAVIRAPGGPAPPGTRGVEFAELGTLLVHLGTAALPAVVTAIRRWVSAGGSRSVTLELDGDHIEVGGMSAADQGRLVDAFIARHPAGAR